MAKEENEYALNGKDTKKKAEEQEPKKSTKSKKMPFEGLKSTKPTFKKRMFSQGV